MHYNDRIEQHVRCRPHRAQACTLLSMEAAIRSADGIEREGKTAEALENTCRTGASDGATDAYIHVTPGRQARRLAPRMIVNIKRTCDVVHPGLQSQLRLPCSNPDMQQTLS